MPQAKEIRLKGPLSAYRKLVGELPKEYQRGSDSLGNQGPEAWLVEEGVARMMGEILHDTPHVEVDGEKGEVRPIRGEDGTFVSRD